MSEGRSRGSGSVGIGNIANHPHPASVGILGIVGILTGPGIRALFCTRCSYSPSRLLDSLFGSRFVKGLTMVSSAPMPQRIAHGDVPIVPSPSGLPTQHLISAETGSKSLFVAQQWLRPGEKVLLHTHPVEESITFLSGAGEATLGAQIVEIGVGTSLYIPAGAIHGFRCTTGTLHVLFAFPIAEFAETTMVERALVEE